MSIAKTTLQTSNRLLEIASMGSSANPNSLIPPSKPLAALQTCSPRDLSIVTTEMESGSKKKLTCLSDLHIQAIRESRAASRSDQKPTLTQILDLQAQRNDLYEHYLAELRSLQAKYEEQYLPLYVQRTELTAGLEGFWLAALKFNSMVAAYISERDEDLLKYLTDIKCTREPSSDSFTISFVFGENPFIANPILEKTYTLSYDSVLEKATSTEIQWLEENLTQRQAPRKQVNRLTKKTRVVQKAVNCSSFFTFFRGIGMPPAQELGEMEASAQDALAAAIQEDYDLACEIRDEVIPNGVYGYLQVDGRELDVKDVEEEERKKPERSDCKHM